MKLSQVNTCCDVAVPHVEIKLKTYILETAANTSEKQKAYFNNVGRYKEPRCTLIESLFIQHHNW